MRWEKPKELCHHPLPDGRAISRFRNPAACAWHVEREDNFCVTECKHGRSRVREVVPGCTQDDKTGARVNERAQMDREGRAEALPTILGRF